MGFFKDFKNDLSETASKQDEEELENAVTDKAEEDVMVKTLDDSEQAKIAADFAKEADKEEKNIEEDAGNVIGTNAEDEMLEEAEEKLDGGIADETAVITEGLTVTGDLDSIGSIDLFGAVTGNVSCRGKLTVSGFISGDSKANEIFADSAQIDGNMEANGAIKVGQGTVIVGNLSAASAVIAGAVKGNIDVHGSVVIDSTAIIVGDIKSKTIQVNNGATIDGRCSQCYAEVNTVSIFDIKPKNKKAK